MGFFDTILKDKKVIEIQQNFLSNPGTIIFFEIGQQIRNGESIEPHDKEGILSSIEVIENYAAYQYEEDRERAALALTLYSVVKFGYDSEQYDPYKIIRYAKKLYISMTGTPDMFKAEHMPIINNLANQLKNKKVNIQQEKTAE